MPVDSDNEDDNLLYEQQFQAAQQRRNARAMRGSYATLGTSQASHQRPMVSPEMHPSAPLSDAADLQQRMNLAECTKGFFLRHCKLLSGVLCLLMVVLTGAVFLTHYVSAQCAVFVSDFTVAGPLVDDPLADALPRSAAPVPLVRGGAGLEAEELFVRAVDEAVSTAMPVCIQVFVDNPAWSEGTLSHASFRVTFVDYRNGGARYVALSQVLYPSSDTHCPEGAEGVVLPKRERRLAHLCSNISLGAPGEKIAHLVYHTSGCFAVAVEGDVRYSVGWNHFTESINRTFQLFHHSEDESACPCLQ